jgi:tRNA-splicing ligase RtcB
MDLARLERLDAYSWSLRSEPGQERLPIVLFGSHPLLETMDEKVLQQVSNVARLPGLVGSVLTMPDAHWGYGFPIGGVAAFDPEQGGIISAGGVGFDISCGIRCLRANLTWSDIAAHADELADALFRVIPAGVGEEGELRLSPSELNALLLSGAVWAVQHGFGTEADLEYTEERGRMIAAEPANVSDLAKRRQRGEMGTLGSGNYYLELQVVERIFDAPAASAFGLHQDQVLISIHCRSRGLGHQIGTDYLVSMAKAAQRLGIVLPDRELASAPICSREGQQYLGAMRAGINCALANRQILTHLTRRVIAQFFPEATLETLYDVAHNTCKAEHHLVNGQERLLYVHRKRATRAFGPGHADVPERYREVGQPVIIGGTTGTGSYILVGTAESERRAWSSASHGAGRAMSRHQAIKQWRGRELVHEVAGNGILIRTRSWRGAAEEAPGAYKDVDLVAELIEQAGLARRVALLRPRVCVKG